MNVLFLTNVPSPYRVEFFNKLAGSCTLTVLYQKEKSNERDSRWKSPIGTHYKSIVMKGVSTSVDGALCLGVVRYLKKDKFDHIVICGVSSPTEILSIFWCKLFGIKYYLEGDGGFHKYGKGIKEKLKKILIPGATLYLSSGKSLDEYYTYYGADSKKIFRYEFTSLQKKDILVEILKQKDKQLIRKRLGMDENLIILTVGRFIYGKGFDVLIDACSNLGKNIGVYFIGGEATQEYLNIVCSRRLSNIHFIGFKTKEELSDYYKSADIFVLPTRQDVWGLVINEAMANGLPVITTDRCGAGIELIEDGSNGFIVPIDNSTELRRAINQLLGNEFLRDDIAKNNIEKISSYTYENMVKSHLILFNENH